MNKHKASERGQALVMIAFAIIGLIALTALAIDGGNVYSDRRNAQNAADTAVMASALNYVRSSSWSAAKAAGLARAASNGYVDNDASENSTSTDTNVEIYNPPVSGPYSDCTSTDFNCLEYVQVLITHQVDTYFAGIVGIAKLTNGVNAVARVEPTYPNPFLPGSAVITLSEHDCPALTIGGTADVTLDGGGGVFVNSDCANDPSANPLAIEFGGGPTLNINDSGGLCSVGPIDTGDPADLAGVTGTIDPNCQPINPATAFVEPNVGCEDPGLPDVGTSGTTLTPGKYPGSGAFQHEPKFPPAGYTQLAPGTYCITEGPFSMSSGSLTGNDVIIYVKDGGISINTDNVVLTGASGGANKGLLFVLPSTNHSAVTINGNAGNSFTGTILAPGSDVTLNGGSSTTGFADTRIISYTSKLNGSAGSIINFNPNNAWVPQIPPQISAIE